MKKKKIKKSTDESMVDHIMELLEIIKDMKHVDKAITNNMMTMFIEILSESPTFHKWLSDPKSDLSKIEPVVKMMVKYKKK